MEAHWKIHKCDELREQCLNELQLINTILGHQPQHVHHAPSLQALEDWTTYLDRWGGRPRRRLSRSGDDQAMSVCEAQLKALSDQLKTLHASFSHMSNDESHVLPLSEVCDLIARYVTELKAVDTTIERNLHEETLYQRVFDEALKHVNAIPEDRRRHSFAHTHTRTKSTAMFKDSDMKWFWNFIPTIEDKKFRYQQEHLKDGYVVSDEKIARTTTTLRAIAAAWVTAAVQRHDIVKLDIVLGMPKIAIILNNITNGRHYFDNFVDRQADDDLLWMSQSTLQTFINGHESRHECLKQFFQVQFRLTPREWIDRDDWQAAGIGSQASDHIDCEPDEPLPLETLEFYDSQGKFSEVYRVRDLVSGRIYALKKSRFDADVQHIRNEVAILRQVDHRHIPKLKRSYTRAGEMGFLIVPAAECNLSKKLFNFATRIDLRPAITPGLLRAFGCLSIGFQYLHVTRVRHRDIKPENVLWHNNKVFIADFGCAVAFTEEDGSRMHDANIGTKGFVAKEARSTNPNLETSGHGRATDVFALGCTFLEMLSALIFGVHPSHDMSKLSVKHIGPYSEKPDEVSKWIKNALQSALGAQYPYKQLLELTGKMMKDSDRPTISDVVSEIRQIEHAASYSTKTVSVDLFCNECKEEMSTETIPEEPSSNAKPSSIHSRNPSQRSKTSSMIRKVKAKIYHAFRRRENG